MPDNQWWLSQGNSTYHFTFGYASGHVRWGCVHVGSLAADAFVRWCRVKFGAAEPELAYAQAYNSDHGDPCSLDAVLM